MPEYLFRNPITNELKSIFFHMTEKKEYAENGIQFIREFTIPAARIDSVAIDPFDKKKFIQRSAQMKGATLGNLYDESRALSEQRKAKAGKDPVKNQYLKDYSKARDSKLHPTILPD